MKKQLAENWLNNRFLNALFIIILTVGIFLRCYQYFMVRSMWEDETHLALNLMSYDYLRLLRPLDFIQGAPILFLFIIKTICLVFGYGELALRAFPFIMSIVTLPLFYFIVLKLTNNKPISLLSFAIFSVELGNIYYSSELKPYSVDLSMYLLLVYIGIADHPFVKRYRLLLLVLAGWFATLVSLSAFIVLFCLACYMMHGWLKDKRINRQEVLVFMLWAAVFITNYILFIHNHPSTKQQRINFASSFCPVNIFSKEFVEFIKTTIDEVFYIYTFRITPDYGFSYILIFLFVLSVAYLAIKRQFTLLIFTCLPILTHLALSAVKIYPFACRLVLYQLPAHIILISFGIYLVARFITQKTHILAGITVCFVFLYFISSRSIKAFPLVWRDIKPALAFVNDSLPQNTHVYVFDPINAYTYYFIRGIAHNPPYKALEWELDPKEFYEIVSLEKSNYVLFYNDYYRWGYGDVIDDLRKKNLEVRDFHLHGFEVSEVKPVVKYNTDSIVATLDYLRFDSTVVYGQQKTIALWNETPANTKSIILSKGSYLLSVYTKGTPAEGVYPHIKVYVNDSLIGSFYNKADYEHVALPFVQHNDGKTAFKILMDNDFHTDKEDRNSFILYLDILNSPVQVKR